MYLKITKPHRQMINGSSGSVSPIPPITSKTVTESGTRKTIKRIRMSIRNIPKSKITKIRGSIPIQKKPNATAIEFTIRNIALMI
jgi:hypothetical protein